MEKFYNASKSSKKLEKTPVCQVTLPKIFIFKLLNIYKYIFNTF